MIYSSSIKVGIPESAYSQPHSAIPSAVLASMLSGVALINLHRLKGIDARAIVAHFSAVATACSFIVWMLLPIRQENTAITSTSVGLLLGVGVAATIGQLCLTKAFASGQPANVSIVGLSQVAFAASFKWAVEHRGPSLVTLAGMGLILASTILVMIESPRKITLDESSKV